MWAHDRKLFLRTFGAALVLALATWAVIAATDEPGSGGALRAARLCALAPLLQILAVFWTLGNARQRGEERALGALGVTPLRFAAGALLGAWAWGGVASFVVASRWVDTSSLFPTLESAPRWSRVGAEWTYALGGVTVDEQGALRFAFVGPWLRASGPRPAAVLAVLPLAVAAPIWAAFARGARVRAVVGLTCAALVVCLLHAVAARWLAELHLIWGALPLALHALWLGVGGSGARLRAGSAGPSGPAASERVH